MAKKQQKSKKNRTPNISPLTMLRPRLDGLLGNEDLATRDDAWIQKDLDAVSKGIPSTQFVMALLQAHLNAPTVVQNRLNEVVPQWLEERQMRDTLVEQVQRQQVDMDIMPQAMTWLEATGIDRETITRQILAETPFWEAYFHGDEFGSQGVLTMMWYTSSQKTKAQGFSFLIDYNPPWEGAIKDSWDSPAISPQRLKEKFVAPWINQGTDIKQISAEEAKQKLFTCLNVNLSESIKLPQDLIPMRQLFWKYISTIPESADTPSFTIQDFDFLSKNGRPPEEINQFEHTVGRTVRGKNGQMIFVSAGAINDMEDMDW